MCRKKKIICGIVCGALVLGCGLAVVIKNGHKDKTPSPVIETTELKPDESVPEKISKPAKSTAIKKTTHEKKG